MNTMDISDTLHCSSGLLKILLQVMADGSEQLKFLIIQTDDVTAVVEVCRMMLIGRVWWYLTYCVRKLFIKNLYRNCVCACVRVCVRVCVCTSLCMYVCVYACTCVPACVHACVCVYACVHMCLLLMS